MTVNPTERAPRRDACAVMPVVDYEPPLRDVQQGLSPSAAAGRPAQGCSARAPRRRSGPQSAPAMSPPSPPMRQAAIFADAALRRALEVIDRRRPAAQLRPLLTAALIDSVLCANRAAAGDDGAAVLRRLRLQAVGPGDPLTAAEVFGTYSRGSRIHAVACRVEQVRTTDGTRWQVVALHIG